jgi:hypothetical protein
MRSMETVTRSRLRFKIKNLGIQCGGTSAALMAQTSIGVSVTGRSSITTVLATPGNKPLR